jgi:hypothetical protein
LGMTREVFRSHALNCFGYCGAQLLQLGVHKRFSRMWQILPVAQILFKGFL